MKVEQPRAWWPKAVLARPAESARIMVIYIIGTLPLPSQVFTRLGYLLRAFPRTDFVGKDASKWHGYQCRSTYIAASRS